MKIIKGVELFAVGIWNGMQFKKKDLEEMATAYGNFAAVLRVPLKFGHNNEQKMTDGQPALGWVTNVRVKGNKLVGDFVDVPELVFSAINNKLYNSLSIELDMDVTYKGSSYPYVLTGVALLGADLPAVNTIGDLAQYIDDKTDKGLKASRQASFSYKPETGGPNMDELEKALAEIESLKARFSALESAQSTLVTENAKLKAENAQFKADAEAKETADKAAKFTIEKKAVTDTLEELVKVEAISPGQRDVFTSQIKDGDLDSVNQVKFTAETLKSGIDPKKFSKDNKMQASDDSNSRDDDTPADQLLFQKIQEARSSNPKLSIKEARNMVFTANPSLAEEYKALTEEV